MGSMSPVHWLIVLVIVLLLFGAGRVADIGKGLGEGIKNFKKGLKDDDEAAPRATEKRRAAVAPETEEEDPPRQLAAKPRKVIEVEVDDDDMDEAELLRRLAKKRAARVEAEAAVPAKGDASSDAAKSDKVA